MKSSEACFSCCDLFICKLICKLSHVTRMIETRPFIVKLQDA